MPADTKLPALAVKPDGRAAREPDWELTIQWSRTWRVIKWAATAIVAIAFLLVIGQGFLFYRLFASIHPWLGLVFVGLLAILLILLVVRPLVSFLLQPVMLEAPKESIDPAAPDAAVLARRIRYDLRYIKMLRSHPKLQAKRAEFDEGLRAGGALLAQVRRSNARSLPNLLGALRVFEAAQIDAHLAALDAEAERLIRAEAVAVGVATAISMNGTVDAFIVLWRNANMVARIARLYGGRPSLPVSLSILRDVATIVVIARALEDVTDLTGDLIGSLLGRMGGLVAGPVMDGAINAMMTLKIGYLARRRCRSYQGWSPNDARRISTAALERVKKDSGAVLTEMTKRCSGLADSAARATESAMAGSKTAWSLVQGWFGVKVASGEAPGG